MHFSDAAIVLSARKYGENGAVVRVLTREHGVFAGVLRSAYSKNNRGIIQAGNVVSAHWNARLSEHLGAFKLELLEAHAAHIMQDAGKLAALTSACAIAEITLPERHPYPKLFASLHKFLHILDTPNCHPHDNEVRRSQCGDLKDSRLRGNDNQHWQQEYVRFELSLLAETGYGLDLIECAATGTTENLIYVSPKSGRAVCKQAGLPYHDKLLPLPNFLLDTGLLREARNDEILEGLKLTGYFLEHSLLASHGKKLPAARQRLLEQILSSCEP